MFGAPHPVTASASPLVPLPRRPLDESCRVRRWYERELGWPTVPGDPVRLTVGVRFDVLDVPAEAGHAALRHLGPGSPVAVRGGRMRLLVAAGSAEELPGLLEWLEWGTLALDLIAIGAGGFMEAPVPGLVDGVGRLVPRENALLPGQRAGLVPPGAAVTLPPLAGPFTGRPFALGPVGSQGAAVWLRPPEPGCEVEASLPTLSALGGGGNAPDLVRLVDTVATHCHRVRLRRACAQPPALRTQGQ
ncbi:SCO3374 family protein [Streptomyces purpurascens]|uniref:SCO3374 family protein n=1 Tax=Streptomyces purpurascens TaxID=1924 RepID=UPI003C303794